MDHIAIKQATTHRWWDMFSGKCDIFISQYVLKEAEEGDSHMAKLRGESMASSLILDGFTPEVNHLSKILLESHVVPDKEITDALHIATAAVYGIDVLLTWNCRYMANPITLPKTSAVIANAGYICPIIITPADFIERREELGYGNKL